VILRSTTTNCLGTGETVKGNAHRPWPWLVSAAAAAGVILLALGVAYYFTYEPAPEIRIRWRDGLDPGRRAELERRFLLVNPAPFEDRLTYDLLDTSRGNVEALVKERDIADTDRVDRVNYTIPFSIPYGSSWMWAAHRTSVLRIPGVVSGIVLVCAAVLVAAAVDVMRRR
jgi:hypothetical protein